MTKLAAAAALLLIGAAVLARPATIEDFLGVPRVNGVALSPDGRLVLLSKALAGKSNVYGARTELSLIDVNSGKSRELTGSPGADPLEPWRVDPQPDWSPDSKSFAYLGSANGTAQVRLYDVASNRARAVTARPAEPKDVTTGLSSPKFSPDGRHIAYVAMTFDRRAKNALKDLAVVSVTEHPEYLSPGDVHTFVEVVDVQTGIVERVSPELSGAQDLQWSPDGRSLLLIPCRLIWGGEQCAEADPSILDVRSRTLRKATRTALADQLPIWSPDARRIAYLSHNAYSSFPWSRSRSLFTMPAAGGEPTKISGDYISLWYGSSSFWGEPLVWSPRGDEIYGIGRERATSRVVAFKPDGSGRRTVTPPQFHVSSYDLSHDGRTMAAIFDNANTPPEVYVGDPASGRFRKLTDFGAFWRGIETLPVETIRWRSLDGRFDVEGFLLKPRDFQAGRRYPLLVSMHGGPGHIYENSFLDTHFTAAFGLPPELFAAAGYLVLLCNVRGDESYGEEFLKALPGNIGTGDVEQDVFGAVDALVARGLAHPEQVGVFGHSYGAFAAAWAVAHSDRFRAASLSDGVFDWLQHYTQIYPHGQWMEFYMQATPGQNVQAYLERSSPTFANRIRTPTIMRVGNAVRPDTEHQAMQLYRSLHQRGVPVELVLQPTQNHVIFDEDVYRDWIARNFDWFDYWLRGRGRPVRKAPEPASKR